MITVTSFRLLPRICATAILISTTGYSASQLSINIGDSVTLHLSGSPAIYGIQGATNLGASAVWTTIGAVSVSNSPAVFLATRSKNPGIYFRAVFLSLIASNEPPNPDPTRWAWIPPGTFLMGSPTNEPGRDDGETQHRVTLTRGFFMSKFETTQREYLRVMSNNPSWFSASGGYPEDLDRPVEWVSWREATNYCGRLTRMEQNAGTLPAGWAYRLPTEAEWEHACRAGTAAAFDHGDVLRSGMANFNGAFEYPPGTTNLNGLYLAETITVGSFLPNRWGLHDMYGNVLEWCLDWYGGYPDFDEIDPKGPSSGLHRVSRGGAWESIGMDCRSAARHRHTSTAHDNTFGLRPVLAAWP